mmetsp:Transcript_85977/g.135754  ORF Transcript_85977/g.135754 Transcript_85977/m.135754 type:complete len:190 (+) Transcript_85977:123-692(+)
MVETQRMESSVSLEAKPLASCAGAERSQRFREIQAYNEKMRMEVANSPNRLRSGCDPPIPTRRSGVGPSPSADTVDVHKIRPATPIEDAVKHINFRSKHMLSYASVLDEQVEEAQKRLTEDLNRKRMQCEAFIDFRRQCHEKTMAERRAREAFANRKKVAEVERVLTGFVQASKSQRPLRKRPVLSATQ